MLSQTSLGVYFWGAYVWLIVGFLSIGVPAVIDMYKIFTNSKKEG